MIEWKDHKCGNPNCDIVTIGNAPDAKVLILESKGRLFMHYTVTDREFNVWVPLPEGISLSKAKNLLAKGFTMGQAIADKLNAQHKCAERN